MKKLVAASLAMALLTSVATYAQDAGAPAPSLAEIMTYQQLRHIKLWFAGSAGNWPLANYEIGELEDGFDDVNSLLGGDTVKAQVGPALDALHKAVEQKNGIAFTAAFDSLSAGCNSCHHLLDHAFIVIQRPTLLPYSNQSFKPQK